MEAITTLCNHPWRSRSCLRKVGRPPTSMYRDRGPGKHNEYNGKHKDVEAEKQAELGDIHFFAADENEPGALVKKHR
jgi:hypothetical protein